MPEYFFCLVLESEIRLLKDLFLDFLHHQKWPTRILGGRRPKYVQDFGAESEGLKRPKVFIQGVFS